MWRSLKAQGSSNVIIWNLSTFDPLLLKEGRIFLFFSLFQRGSSIFDCDYLRQPSHSFTARRFFIFGWLNRTPNTVTSHYQNVPAGEYNEDQGMNLQIETQPMPAMFIRMEQKFPPSSSLLGSKFIIIFCSLLILYTALTSQGICRLCRFCIIYKLSLAHCWGQDQWSRI